MAQCGMHCTGEYLGRYILCCRVLSNKLCRHGSSIHRTNRSMHPAAGKFQRWLYFFQSCHEMSYGHVHVLVHVKRLGRVAAESAASYLSNTLLHTNAATAWTGHNLPTAFLPLTARLASPHDPCSTFLHCAILGDGSEMICSHDLTI